MRITRSQWNWFWIVVLLLFSFHQDKNHQMLSPDTTLETAKTAATVADHRDISRASHF